MTAGEEPRPESKQSEGSELVSTQNRYDMAFEFYTAVTTGDWDRFRAVCSSDVAWTLPGDNAVSGRLVGVEAAIEHVQLIASYGVTFTLEHILVSRDNIALALHNTAHRDDAVLDEHLATVCHITDGHIDEIETYVSDEPGMDRFFC